MKIFVTILIGFFVTFCSEQQELLERIKHSGELRVVTRASPTTCYRSGNRLVGFECSLARRFAEELGVRLKVILVENDRDVIRAMERGEGDLAAGINTVFANGSPIHFGPVYQEIRRKVVYRRGEKRPGNVQDLAGRLVEVASGHGYAAMLRKLSEREPDLIWREHSLSDTQALLSLVLQRKVDLTIVDSNEIALLRQHYPELRSAFELGKPQALAWGTSLNADDSLHLQILLFFEKIKKSGELGNIIERHYGHMGQFNYVETHLFLRHARTRLPGYIAYFKKAAAKYGLDWRLLSAIGYQESHWNPDAVSPTGVRGIMMLTTQTARQLGVADRTDEEDSILGGARYFAQTRARLPGRIEEPDRTWFALAAYNVGLGHLEDARILAQRAGSNPDRWRDVREFLPLISKEEWYTKTKHGYARGHEPVQFVRNIRRYYDRLVWLDRQ
uniref:Membrane-bound lytic murein transglycosylase F n=1 Tax=Candidatus Kentrum sp. DK TaxID=2126562 RepID=A0A450T0M0_9GAMM|nr:MAG: membrane-bound lytic murein transglycosylase F [Candidatus Kentron sp. DK]